MTCREDDKSGCAWMCQIFVIQSKEGQNCIKNTLVLVQFFYQDMIVYAMGDFLLNFCICKILNFQIFKNLQLFYELFSHPKLPNTL